MYFYKGSCFSQCPGETFLEEKAGVCYDVCPPGMTPRIRTQTCRISSFCEEPSKYFNKITKTCDPCNRNCKACNGPTDHDCLLCEKGQFLSISPKILANPFFLKKYFEFIENPYEELYLALIDQIPFAGGMACGNCPRKGFYRLSKR